MIYGLLTILIVAFTLNSCVKDTDYETPQITCEEPTIDSNSIISIEEIKQIWVADNPGENDRNIVKIAEEDANPIYLKGYVVSNDNGGNFYQELFVQDSPANPTQAIKVGAAVNDMFLKYDVGRELYVLLNGLYINMSHGEMMIGDNNDNQIDEMSEAKANNHFLRNCEAVEVTPMAIASPASINNSYLGMLVELTNMQFADNLIGEKFTDSDEDYDTHREMMSCIDGSTLRIETSGFADFKDNLLPIGKGSVSGILSRDYGDDFYVLRMANLESISFTEERCSGVDLTPTMTLSELINGQQGELGINEDIVEAYVVSNDAAGNFYKSIYVQDSPTNPTAGLQILTDEYDLFTKYPVGSKVYIKLNTLYFGQSYGVMSLGYFYDGYVGRISEGELGNYLVNSGEMSSVTPLSVELTETGEVVIAQTSDPAPQAVLMQFENMQLNMSELGSAYAYFHGVESVNRTIYSCDTESTIIMRNSGYSSFANDEFPQAKGSLTAILSQYLGTNQLIIRDTNDVDFSEDRCDPEMLDCGLANAQGTTNLFSDDFELLPPNSPISGNGWTNFIEAGTEGWEAFSSTGANSSLGVSARIGSYQSGDASTVAWLITPAIDFDAQEGETLVFKTSNSFSDGSNLELVYSTDWDGTTGNISDATWGLLPAAYIVQDGDFYGDWFDSGIVDLSCAEGTMYIAFKYTGSGDAEFDGTYELDEISVDF